MANLVESPTDSVQGTEQNCNSLLLLEALKTRHYDNIELLLKDGCDVNVKEGEIKTATLYSVGQNDLKITRLLLRSRPNIDDSGELLFLAARKEFVEMVELLVEFGADVNASDMYGQTALHFAVLQDSTRSLRRQNSTRNVHAIEAIVRTLLNKGADVNAVTTNGFGALHYAVNFGYSNVVSTLLEFGADVHTMTEQYIKHAATEECFSIGDQIYSLMASRLSSHNRADGPWRDPLTTILHIAVRNKYTEIVNLLLNHGTRVDAVQFDGKTPLLTAIEAFGEGYDETVELPSEFDAPEYKNSFYGMSSPHYATGRSASVIIKTLLQKGAQVNRVDCDGNTPLITAVNQGYVEVVQLLLDHGADIDFHNTSGLTPLHFACINCNVKVVSVLLKAGADVNLTCKRGRVPYDYTTNCEMYYWNKTLMRRCYGGRRYIYSHVKAVEVLRVFHGHVNMMHLIGLHLHQSNVPGNASRLSPAENKDELTRFKTKIVHNNLTLNDFLKEIPDPVYVLNDSVMRGLDRIMTEMNEEHPEMRNVLKYVVRKATVRFELLNDGQEWFLYLIGASNAQLPMLPREVARRVLYFLREEDIKSVIQCGENLNMKVNDTKMTVSAEKNEDAQTNQ